MRKLKPLLEMNNAEIEAHLNRLQLLKNKVCHNLIKDHMAMSYHQVENTRKRLGKLMKMIDTAIYVRDEI